ncbi:hypothetical protein TIFTF001_051537 [Ficus carica]|uniref:Ankyrin repeat protein n=1 Tax=Ficus carica TaxID=3494 RepID=A0AA88CQ84_FICCA|nr:hypothetical protein TIFTF001_051537 [Ficus carica]
MSEWWSYSSRKRKHYPATSRGRRDVAKDMMRTSNKEKDTALHEAVRFNHLGVVKILSKVDPLKQARDSALLGCRERIPRMVTAILDNYSSPAYGPMAELLSMRPHWRETNVLCIGKLCWVTFLYYPL